MKGPRYTRWSLKPSAEALFSRANKEWDRRKLRSAFRLFLSGARAGDPCAQVNLGYFYDTRLGTKPNRRLALRWYKKAFQQGYAATATNIGTIFRDEGQLREALVWFRRAINLADGDANLEIAKIYLRRERGMVKATSYLRKTLRSNQATEGSKEEARLLLKELKTKKAKGASPKMRPKGSARHVRAK